ncbi:hypothetical protein CAOG_07696 [Capsaspora owczarzaki ATCC 30864]|uniref:Adhesin domain-containing protein n=1 Tax=Capsaspora owczarzaki (strain ATCC 30864) TaxID=595528 RepID=A0A0D2X563_CAPO3|nr:hypothetical protein CAOG_07696 [Capsaspora owczarzaki ATCC 30864]KJE97259.1 hypothetical protein CAOG_007696 [Capsaspora owczarzaki ATCC 30864]|eukprot:XP_004343570.1 hypothetical protein CAOG_07696 [Capsaspora owczarzaki ATCC 30864]
MLVVVAALARASWPSSRRWMSTAMLPQLARVDLDPPARVEDEMVYLRLHSKPKSNSASGSRLATQPAQTQLRLSVVADVEQRRRVSVAATPMAQQLQVHGPSQPAEHPSATSFLDVWSSRSSSDRPDLRFALVETGEQRQEAESTKHIEVTIPLKWSFALDASTLAGSTAFSASKIESHAVRVALAGQSSCQLNSVKATFVTVSTEDGDIHADTLLGNLQLTCAGRGQIQIHTKAQGESMEFASKAGSIHCQNVYTNTLHISSGSSGADAQQPPQETTTATTSQWTIGALHAEEECTVTMDGEYGRPRFVVDSFAGGSLRVKSSQPCDLDIRHEERAGLIQVDAVGNSTVVITSPATSSSSASAGRRQLHLAEPSATSTRIQVNNPNGSTQLKQSSSSSWLTGALSKLSLSDE